MIVELDVVLTRVVRRVEVVGERGELGGDSIDLFDERGNSILLTKTANSKLGRVHAGSELTIREAELLGLTKEVGVDGGDITVTRTKIRRIQQVEVLKNLLQARLHPEDRMKLGQEPLIDVGHLPDLVNRVTLVEGRPESEDTLVSRVDKFFINVLNNVVLARIGISEGP